MKALYPIVFAVVLVFVLAGPASGVTNIGDPYTHPDLYFVKQDPCNEHVIFTPPAAGGKYDFHQEPVSLCVNATRRVVWRVDIMVNGSYSDFDWKVIMAGLDLMYGVKIGVRCDCTIIGQVTGPCGYWATVECYSAYSRTTYRVEQDGMVAIVSVLTPADGMIPVIVGLRDKNGVEYEPEPAANGLCATARFLPFNGNTCGSDGKTNFEDTPHLTDPEVPATWGRIKALYE